MDRTEVALSLLRSGDARGALAAARAACEQEGESANLLTLIAELLVELKEPEGALQCLRRAALLSPTDAGAHRREAGAQFAAQSWSEAAASYRRALELDPDSPRALNNLGQAYERLGDEPQALACYRRAIALDGAHAIAHGNLANLLAKNGGFSEALHHYERALALRPGLVEVWTGRARLLVRLRRPVEALACCDRAIALAPRFAEAWFTRGEALQDIDKFTEALQCCEQVLALGPHKEAMFARANLLRGMGDAAGAVAGFEAALRLDPDYHAARIAAAIARIPALPASGSELEQSRRDHASAISRAAKELRGRNIDAPACVGTVQPFFLAYQEEDQRALLAAHGSLCSDLMRRWQIREGLSTSPANPGARLSRRRIGIVSAQISNHSVYNAITRGWLICLDRKRFEVDVYHLGFTQDGLTREAQEAADYFAADLPTVREWYRAIAERRPDIVLYPELGIDQRALQLAAMRLAPVQAVSWGHPVTSGLPTIDYFLSAEAFEPEQASEHYTEKLVRLPNLGVYCIRSDGFERQADAVPIRTVDVRGTDVRAADVHPTDVRSTDVPIFVCAGTPFKYAPEYDSVLVEIARRLGACQFHFFSYRDGSLSQRLMRRLLTAFIAGGLDGTRHLVLRPWASATDFASFLRRADLFLDTLGFSGFNTVLQALECGLPVIAYRGRFMRGRLGSGLLERLSLSGLVASNPRQYVELAVSLARDPAARLELRERLLTATAGVYRDRQSLDALQDFLATVAG